MKRNRFTEEQIIGIMKEHEAVGLRSPTLCRKRKVSATPASRRIKATVREPDVSGRQ